MDEQFVSYSVDNDNKFRDALNEAQKAVGDLTIPLTLIAKDFFKSEKAIFKLQSKGQYPDLAESTKKARIRLKQPIYPILVRSGALERSVTDPTDSNAINYIKTKDTLIIGTSVKSDKGYPYPAVHQFGTKKKRVPMRKFLFIGPEAPQYATSEMMGRLERWTSILRAYVQQKTTANGAVAGNLSG